MNRYRHEADDTMLEERVASLLSAAAAPSEPGPLPGERAALAAFRASQVPTRRSSMLSSLTAAKAGIAATIGAGLLLTGGVAAAATGTLPGAAQDTVDAMLVDLGVSVPGVDDASAGNADSRGASEDARVEDAATSDETTDPTADDADRTDVDLPDAAAHGEQVSRTATTTESTGADKGAEISELASSQKAKAGDDHGKAGAEHGAVDARSDHEVGADVVKSQTKNAEKDDDAAAADKADEDDETSGTGRRP